MVLDEQLRDRRFWAAVIDLWGFPLAGEALAWLVAATVAAVPQGIGAAVGLAAVVVVEAATGRSPGKRWRGLVLVGPDGGPTTVAARVVRRAWVALFVFARVGGTVAAVAAPLNVLVLLSVALTITRDPEDRGWHDHLAGTRVVLAPAVRQAILAGRDVSDAERLLG